MLSPHEYEKLLYAEQNQEDLCKNITSKLSSEPGEVQSMSEKAMLSTLRSRRVRQARARRIPLRVQISSWIRDESKKGLCSLEEGRGRTNHG